MWLRLLDLCIALPPSTVGPNDPICVGICDILLEEKSMEWIEEP